MAQELPEFKTLRVYVDPIRPASIPSKGVRVAHAETSEIVAPDLVCRIRTSNREGHTGPSNPYHRSSVPESIFYQTVDGEVRATYHGRVNVCEVVLADETVLRNIIGTREEVAQLLRPYACPPAAATGITLDVTNGSYTLYGDCGGRLTLAVGDPAITLDPRRLTEAGEWSVAKVTSGGGRTTNYRFRIRQAAGKTFTLQQWVPPTGPGKNDGAWRDVTGAVNTLQAATRFRVKP